MYLAAENSILIREVSGNAHEDRFRTEKRRRIASRDLGIDGSIRADLTPSRHLLDRCLRNVEVSGVNQRNLVRTPLAATPDSQLLAGAWFRV